MTPPTPYAHVNELLADILVRLQMIFGEKLVGLYLYGSLVTGDFDDISDVDLLAAVASDLSADELVALAKMHGELEAPRPSWESRIEVAYLSLHALKTFKEQSSTIGIISPGEPFHTKEAGSEWLLNWHIVRELGVTLFGPPPKEIIAPTTKVEYAATVKQHAQNWREYIQEADKSRPFQGYAILTMCRAYYSYAHGGPTSKRKAAAWVAQQMPQWAGLIQSALQWRQAWREEVDAMLTFAETRRFVFFMIEQIGGKE